MGNRYFGAPSGCRRTPLLCPPQFSPVFQLVVRLNQSKTFLPVKKIPTSFTLIRATWKTPFNSYCRIFMKKKASMFETGFTERLDTRFVFSTRSLFISIPSSPTKHKSLNINHNSAPSGPGVRSLRSLVAIARQSNKPQVLKHKSKFCGKHCFRDDILISRHTYV